MKVLVTGANGLVGSRLVAALAQQGHEPIGLGRAAPTASAVRFVRCDLTDAAAVRAVLREVSPEAIVNCAAMTDVDGCERDPSGAWAANAEAPATLARHARESGCHLVHVSTDYVFDGDHGPYDVDAIPNPRGAYALSKRAGEEAVLALTPKAQATLARTAVVFGWPAVAGKNNFGAWLVSTLAQNKPVKLFMDQWVSPSHASNVADMLGELALKRLPGVFHTSGADVVDRVTFGHRLCERFGFDRALVEPSRMVDVNLPSPRPARSGLVVTRTAAALQHHPWTLETALERLHTEYRGTP